MSKVNPLIPYYQGGADSASVRFNRGNVKVYVSEDGVDVSGNPIVAPRLEALLPPYDPETNALAYLMAQNWGDLYLRVRAQIKG